jgi:AraC-like DNA-binding protein
MVLSNELLAQNEKSVTEIALECGYSLPHSFYKAYKRVYGHAPTLPNGMRGEINENDL